MSDFIQLILEALNISASPKLKNKNKLFGFFFILILGIVMYYSFYFLIFPEKQLH